MSYCGEPARVGPVTEQTRRDFEKAIGDMRDGKVISMPPPASTIVMLNPLAELLKGIPGGSVLTLTIETPKETPK